MAWGCVLLVSGGTKNAFFLHIIIVKRICHQANIKIKKKYGHFMRYGSVETAPRKINKKKIWRKVKCAGHLRNGHNLHMFGPSKFLCNIRSKCSEKGIIACDSAMLSACVSFHEMWPHEYVKLKILSMLQVLCKHKKLINFCKNQYNGILTIILCFSCKVTKSL